MEKGSFQARWLDLQKTVEQWVNLKSSPPSSRRLMASHHEQLQRLLDKADYIKRQLENWGCTSLYLITWEDNSLFLADIKREDIKSLVKYKYQIDESVTINIIELQTGKILKQTENSLWQRNNQ